jgi:hypothetical protein
MKAKFCLLFVVVALASCASYPKQGDRIPSEKVILVGRMDPGVDLKEFFGIKSESKLVLNFFWNSEPPETATGATFVHGYSKIGDYFILTLPRRSRLYLLGMEYVPLVSVGDQVQLNFDFEKLSVAFPEGKELVYIGDFRVAYRNDEPTLFIDDKYEEAQKNFAGFFKDAKGGPAALAKSMPEGSKAVTATRVTQRVYLSRTY